MISKKLYATKVKRLYTLNKLVKGIFEERSELERVIAASDRTHYIDGYEVEVKNNFTSDTVFKTTAVSRYSVKVLKT